MKPLLFILGLLIGLGGGYFAGREHLKYEIKSGVESAARVAMIGLTNMFKPPSSRRDDDVAARNEKVRYANDHLEISAQPARKGTTTDGVWWIKGAVKNNGPRSIKALVVKVVFLDADGNAIHEESPAAFGAGAFGSNPPLRPNYERDFELFCHNVPAAWTSGKFRYGFEDLEWADKDGGK